MRAWIWAVAAASGFGLMLFAYSLRDRPDAGTPWAYGAADRRSALKDRGRSGLPGPVIPTHPAVPARQTSGSRSSSVILGEKLPGGATALQAQLRPKLILLPAIGATIGTGFAAR